MVVLEATLNIIAVVLKIGELARLTIMTQMGLLGKGIRRGDYGQINNLSTNEKRDCVR